MNCFISWLNQSCALIRLMPDAYSACARTATSACMFNTDAMESNRSDTHRYLAVYTPWRKGSGGWSTACSDSKQLTTEFPQGVLLIYWSRSTLCLQWQKSSIGSRPALDRECLCITMSQKWRPTYVLSLGFGFNIENKWHLSTKQS